MPSLVGSTISPIRGLQFIKGEEVEVPSSSGPRVLELWASWCGPCRAVFPHLSSLQHKYKDKGLKVVGVNIEGMSPQVQAFVTQQGANMDYAVAVDTAESAQQLMVQAGVSGIPFAVVIDAAGVVRFQGHPADPQFEKTIKQVCESIGPAPEQKKTLPRVTATREELLAMPVRELKQILQDRKIGFADLHEKTELVDRIIERCSNVAYTV